MGLLAGIVQQSTYQRTLPSTTANDYLIIIDSLLISSIYNLPQPVAYLTNFGDIQCNYFDSSVRIGNFSHCQISDRYTGKGTLSTYACYFALLAAAVVGCELIDSRYSNALPTLAYQHTGNHCAE
jgi:hypothetical protein